MEGQGQGQVYVGDYMVPCHELLASFSDVVLGH